MNTRCQLRVPVVYSGFTFLLLQPEATRNNREQPQATRYNLKFGQIKILNPLQPGTTRSNPEQSRVTHNLFGQFVELDYDAKQLLKVGVLF